MWLTTLAGRVCEKTRGLLVRRHRLKKPKAQATNKRSLRLLEVSIGELKILCSRGFGPKPSIFENPTEQWETRWRDREGER